MSEQADNKICARDGHFLAHVSGLGVEAAKALGWGRCQRCGQECEPLLDGPTVVVVPENPGRQRPVTRQARRR
jgi:hypothetical protein